MQYTVGLISDTHAVFDKAAAATLKHASLIVHAGDVGHHGRHREVLQLYAEATGTPLLAVAGNVDDKLDAADKQLLPQHRLVQAAGWKLLVCHIVASGPTAKVDAAAAELISRLQPDIVVCGHSHKACCWQADGIAYVNPGSAGPARFKLPRTVALLQLPHKTAAAAAAAGTGQPDDGKGTGSDKQLAVNAEPAGAQQAPATGIAADGNNGRDSKSGAGPSCEPCARNLPATVATERHATVDNSMSGGQGGMTPAAAEAATAVASRSASQVASGGIAGSGAVDAWLGRLHVRFLQLPQKAPPRLTA